MTMKRRTEARKQKFKRQYAKTLTNKRRRWKRCNATSKYKTYDDALAAQGRKPQTEKMTHGH